MIQSADDVRVDANGPVVLIGGWGTVGAEVARLLKAEEPGLPLVLAGRTAARGQALADELGCSVQVLDLSDTKPLMLRARAVVMLVNDHDDRVLRACLVNGVPLIDITRWTSRVASAMGLAAISDPKAPLVLASGWMGGLVPWTVSSLARELGSPTDAAVGIVYDLNDRSGEDAIEYMDRLGVPFEIVEHAKPRSVMPLTDAVEMTVAGRAHHLVRIDTPEQFTLPFSLGLRSAQTRIGFSSGLVTMALRVLRALGFFALTKGPRFRGLRRALLRSSGEGGRALIRVTVNDATRSHSATLIDPRGQAHLTALGALRATQRALGLDGEPARAGVNLPEAWPGDARGWLQQRLVQHESTKVALA